MILTWDEIGTHYYENGTDHGVLYLQDDKNEYSKGVAWNGLTAVNESPSGAEANDLWADNIKYASMRSAETFGATIEAYTYPDEFAQCDGSAEPVKGLYVGQQARKPFGFSYRTEVHNDTASDLDDGYKLHLIYNATASPSSRDYATINDSPEAITFSWEIETTPIACKGYKPTSVLTINSVKTDKDKLKELEDILYGTESTEPRLPLPAEVIELMGGYAEDSEDEILG